MRILCYLLLLSIFAVSCNRAKQKAKDTIHGAGETVGKGSSEFFRGIAEGVDESFAYTVELSDHLQSKGVRIGKCRVSVPGDSSINVLTAYLIFENDIKEEILVKLFDKNGLEYGRTKTVVTGKKGEAGYVDIAFDNRTIFESKSRFVFK